MGQRDLVLGASYTASCARSDAVHTRFVLRMRGDLYFRQPLSDERSPARYQPSGSSRLAGGPATLCLRGCESWTRLLILFFL